MPEEVQVAILNRSASDFSGSTRCPVWTRARVADETATAAVQEQTTQGRLIAASTRPVSRMPPAGHVDVELFTLLFYDGRPWFCIAQTCRRGNALRHRCNERLFSAKNRVCKRLLFARRFVGNSKTLIIWNNALFFFWCNLHSNAPTRLIVTLTIHNYSLINVLSQ